MTILGEALHHLVMPVKLALADSKPGTGIQEGTDLCYLDPGIRQDDRNGGYNYEME